MSSTVDLPRGVSRDALDQVLASAQPRWLRDWRLQAWHVFEETPWPNSRTDEEWRRTNVMGTIHFDRYHFGGVTGENAFDSSSLPDELGIQGSEGRAALLVTRQGRTAREERGALPDGVIFTSLERACADYPDLVQRYLGTTAAPLAHSKFAALNATFWRGGAFLYIPRFVEVALPLQALHWVDVAGEAMVPRTLIVLEDGAQVTMIDQMASADQADVFANPVTELYVGRGARLRYVNLQQLGTAAYAVGMQRAVLDANSQFNSLTVTLGSRWHKSNVDVLLNGEGAETEMLGICFADGTQFVDHHTFQDHIKPGAKSDLLYKAALKDHSRTVWTGMIRVHPNAQRTDAYQANRNLLLSGHVRADSIPGLEIGANEVRCTHGATAGPVDPEQVFYLMARGLSRATATQLIVEGFFEPVLQRITLEPLRLRVAQLIARRVETVV